MKKLMLFYPVRPMVANQSFGVVNPYYRANGVPIDKHNGVDFKAAHGQPVFATHDGIAYRDVDSKGGHGVVLRTVEPFEYNGEVVFFKTIYWHFCDGDVEPSFSWAFQNGQIVKAGDLLGYADNTGLSTGDHLHFGLKPQKQGEPNFIWYNVEQDNGLLGCIDPTPYFNGFFGESAKQVISIREQIINLQEQVNTLMHQTKLEQFCRAIETNEGMDTSTNNPGALRWSPTEDGKKSYQGKGTFATFKTYQKGWAALVHQVTIVANGTSPAYNVVARKLGLANSSEMSFVNFFHVYSPSSDHNNPDAYATFVAGKMGLSVDTKMKELLV